MTWSIGNKLKSKAWAAIFVLLMQALLPAVSYATASRGGFLAEVCTAFGIKKIASPDSDSPDGMAMQQHCPICSVAQMLALPNSHAALPLPSSIAFEIPQQVDSQEYAAVRLSPWLRGPPAYA
ncbi:DUF2946 domain-containing protein [Noviherbaspirillum cavernae]|uniref:DUF2946 domain-containing protein n=1 Tax=Noviherbaspirillum cavernae TaxID=2320862 RepID=A0A418WYX2_9BURK|nr:DUF2946 domain-containing protein [Noviherbaspirillum cavernae]RJG05448.1 DUF2946 domain-containing protein [Noviherbaspirillum cavernae]